MNAVQLTSSRTGRRAWASLIVAVLVLGLAAATWPVWLGLVTGNPGADVSYDTATGELALTDTAADGATVNTEYCWADTQATRCDEDEVIPVEGTLAEGQTITQTLVSQASHIVYRACRDAPASIRGCTGWTTVEATQP